MSPPTHVKVASAISSIALGTLGVLGVVAPGESRFKLQSFLGGGKASGDMSRGEVRFWLLISATSPLSPS